MQCKFLLCFPNLRNKEKCSCNHTEVDDSDSDGVWCDSQHFNDGLDEVDNELPVVASRRVVVADTSRVVNHERKISNARCNSNKNDNAVKLEVLNS